MTSSIMLRAPRLQLEGLEDRCVPSAFDFVTSLYTDLLNRVPAPEEVAGWVAALNQGTSPPQVVLGFTQGREFRTNLIRLNYNHLLDREPTTFEGTGWLSLFDQGLREEQFQAEIVASAEYLLNQGNNVVTWLNGIYRDVLNRPIDAVGLNFWVTQLQIGFSPSAVALGITGSHEAHFVVVGGAYLDLLDRLPDSQGLTTWVTSLDRGMTLAQLLANIAGSQEFINLNAGGSLNDVLPAGSLTPLNPGTSGGEVIGDDRFLTA